MKIGEAKKIAGTLSFPTKMPGTSYSLPAKACKAGSKLVGVKGSVCSTCYVLRGGGSYNRKNAATGMQRRLEGLSLPLWVEAMVSLLLHEHSKPRIKVDMGARGVRAQKAGGSRFKFNETGFHRWHDSGDLQSAEHFARICEVARRTPNIRHWLPTQELSMVMTHLRNGGTIPDNLVVRVSTVMIDDPHRRAWPQTSMVYTRTPPPGVHACPAPKQDNECKSCRACWSRDVPHVAYHQH